MKKDSNHSIVFNHFADLTNQWNEKQLTKKEIDDSCGQLKRKLLGWPISKTLNMAICGVIGAMAGAAIGAVATFWSGGIGAIPGALVGFSLGATFGFFHNKKKQAACQAAQPLYEGCRKILTDIKNIAPSGPQEENDLKQEKKPEGDQDITQFKRTSL